MDRSNSSSFSLPQLSHEYSTSLAGSSASNDNKELSLNNGNLPNQKSSIESSSDESEGNSGNTRMRRFPPDAKTSKYRGVSLLKNRGIWRARVEYRGKREHLGYFNSEEEAAVAYDDRLLQLFGKKSKFNFPDRITSKLMQESTASSLSLSVAVLAPVQHQSGNEDRRNIAVTMIDNTISSSSIPVSTNQSMKRVRDNEGSKNDQSNNSKIFDDAKGDARDMCNTSPQSLLGTPPLMNHIDNIHSMPYPLYNLGSQYIGNRISGFPNNNNSRLANRSRNNDLFGLNRLDNVIGSLGMGVGDSRLSQPLLFNHSLSSSLLLPFTSQVNANQMAFPTLINNRYSLPDITFNMSYDVGNVPLYPIRVPSSPPQQQQLQSVDEQDRQKGKEDSQPRKKRKKR